MKGTAFSMGICARNLLSDSLPVAKCLYSSATLEGCSNLAGLTRRLKARKGGGSTEEKFTGPLLLDVQFQHAPVRHTEDRAPAPGRPDLRECDMPYPVLKKLPKKGTQGVHITRDM